MEEKPMVILDAESGFLYIFAFAPLVKLERAARGTSPEDCDRPNEPCLVIRLDCDAAVEEAERLTAIAIEELDKNN